MKNILIPSVGRRVELVKLIKNKFNCKVIGCGIDKYMPAAFFCDDFEKVSPIQSGSYVEDLLAVCKKHDVGYILPVIDIDCKILAQNKKNLHPVVPIVSPIELIEKCFDKLKTVKFFDSVFACRAPVITSSFDEEVVVRPRFGFGSKQLFFCKNYDEAVALIKNQNVKNPIIQKRIFGKEYTTDIYVGKDGEIYSMSHRERLSVRGGEIVQGRISSQPIYVEEALIRIATEGFWGPINVQYIISDGIPYFIEVNPRFGGGLPMTVAGGQDQISMLLDDLSGNQITCQRNNSTKNLICLRYDQTLYTEITDEREDQKKAMENALG